MSAERSSLAPPAAARERTVVATRTPRDFSPALRAQGLSAERETAPAAKERIVPAPKRTFGVMPPEGATSGQRPRGPETPNARRQEPSSAPGGAPSPGPRGTPAPPDSSQGKRPPTNEGDTGRKVGPPPPPPRSAESRQPRPHGAQEQQQHRRPPETKHGQPPQQQRPAERPPDVKEKQPEK